MSEHIVIPAERAGLELDEFLCLLFPDWNKGALRRQVRDGAVLIDGQPARPSQRLRPEQVLSLDIDDSRAPLRPVAPRQRPLDILFEDDSVLVVNKPADLATEPERWAREAPSLAGALLALAESRGPEDEELVFRPRLVHRIDKGTSGAVIVAKNLETGRHLRAAFDQRGVEKEYLALVEGEHPVADGAEELLDFPIGPDPRKSGRMMVSSKGKPSRTRVSVAERFSGYTLVLCRPETGRTHQIRVHLAHAGFPLAIDSLYGRRDQINLSEFKSGYRPKRGQQERPLMARLTLHAAAVTFPTVASEADGRTPGEQRVEAALPKDFERVLAQLRKVRRWNR